MNSIQSIIIELNNYRHKDKNSLLEKYIQERLSLSVVQYYSKIDRCFTNLIDNSNEIKLLRKLNKD